MDLQFVSDIYMCYYRINLKKLTLCYVEELSLNFYTI